MGSITPCLWFDGDAEEAANLYTSVIRNSRILMVSRAGGQEDPAMTVSFELDGLPFVGLNGGPQYSFTEAVSFQISCADQAEVDHYWNALTTDGGEESRCGWLKDRFGVSWQIIPEVLPTLIGGEDPEGAQRAMNAMLGMRKLDIAALEAAYSGS